MHLNTASLLTTRTIEFFPSEELTAGSHKRAAQALRITRSTFRQRLECSVTDCQGGILIHCPLGDVNSVLQVCEVVEQKLQKLQKEPLTGRMVEQILSITSAELRRWSKQGRVPTAGHTFFSSGRKQVSLFLYSPDIVRELATRPQQIADWRHPNRS
ncbi:hypothetical protein [Bradyrhizobium sp. USDA 3364]